MKRIILFVPALLSLIAIPAFMFFAALVFFPVIGIMILDPKQWRMPFFFGWKAFKNIMKNDFKTALE